MDTSAWITAFVTLFVTIDPIGLTPMFAALTQGMDNAKRAQVARTATFVAIGVLLLFGLVGEALLESIGISMAAFRIAGGLLLFVIALDMLFERRSARRSKQADQEVHSEEPHDPGVFPLGIPLMAGPGAIATVILLSSNASGAGEKAGVLGMTVAVLALSWVLFRFGSTLLMRMIGDQGIVVVTRLLGMLLAALSVQFVLDGLDAVLPFS